MDWACGQVSGGGGGSVHACLFINRMWTGRVAIWVGLEVGMCVFVCLQIG